ncbi:MAG: threonylcarbamoyl-AMP synthase [Muribaculaceae bacterium]|nr:threonylcarbamoyl-AMP synthase [Muribaculaceae bacterium]
MNRRGINTEFEEDIKACLDALKNGGLILYPTDTVWGIGCDATNAEAVKKVYALKKRADSKALIVLVDCTEVLDHYVVDVPYMAYELINVAVKPLTIVYEGAFNLAQNLMGENDSVGIRVTSEPFTHELCRRFGRPIVSTSANVSGGNTAHSFREIVKEIKDGVDYVVKYRRNDPSSVEPSNVILLSSDGTFKILR